MLGGRCEGVDNADARFRLERGDEIVEQGVRLCDLVIHVHQNRNVDRNSWQLRIVRLTKANHNVLQSEIAHPLAQALQILGYDVFCDDATLGSDDRREPYDVDLAAVIAAAAETGTRIEINGGPERLDLPDTWIPRAIASGAALVASSDAHAIEELEWMELAVATARRGWATAGAIANTRDLDAMLASRKKV